MQTGSAELEHSKAVYRTLYEQLEQERQELAQSTESLERLKGDFQDRFRAWYTQECSENGHEDLEEAQVAGGRSDTNGAGGSRPVCSIWAACDTTRSCASNCLAGSSPARRHPADYNSESKTFYDAQRRMEVAAGCGSNKGKLGHLGQGWRISC